MEERLDRIAAVRALLTQNGFSLDESNEAVGLLEEWLLAHVESDPDDPTRPEPAWLSVAFDVGVFLGETMIGRRQELRWELLTSPRRAQSFQRPVIIGFSDPAMHIDPVWRVSSLVFRAAQGATADDGSTLLRMLWGAKATADWSPRQSF